MTIDFRPKFVFIDVSYLNAENLLILLLTKHFSKILRIPFIFEIFLICESNIFVQMEQGNDGTHS